MKRLVSAICLLLALALFVAWLGSRLGRDVTRMEAYLDRAEDFARDGEWEQARDSLAALEKIWRGAQPLYRITLEQRILDEADKNMTRVAAAADNKDKAGFFMEAASLRSSLEGIARMEKISWDTVF